MRRVPGPRTTAIAVALLLASLGLVPAVAGADGHSSHAERRAEGCEIPGSGNGLGDTLAIVSRVTCG